MPKKSLNEITEVLDEKFKEKLEELQALGVVEKDLQGHLVALLPTPKCDRDKVMLATGKLLALKYINDLINGKK